MIRNRSNYILKSTFNALCICVRYFFASLYTNAKAEWNFVEDKDAFTDKSNEAAAVETSSSGGVDYTMKVVCDNSLGVIVTTGLPVIMDGDLEIRYRVGEEPFRDTKWPLNRGYASIRTADWAYILSNAKDGNTLIYTIRDQEPYGSIISFSLDGLQTSYRQVYDYCKSKPGSYDLNKWPSPQPFPHSDAGAAIPQSDPDPPPPPVTSYTQVSVIDVVSSKGELDRSLVKIDGWLSVLGGDTWYIRPEPHSNILLRVNVDALPKASVKELLQLCDGFIQDVEVLGRADRDDGYWTVRVTHVEVHPRPTEH